MASASGVSSSTGNETIEPKRLTIQDLDKITYNLSPNRLIGQGAYGKVYKGELENGDEVAVKVLHGNMVETDDIQFQQEFNNLMMLNHPNIVRLVGYCYETPRQHMNFHGRLIFGERTCRALCFEYMHKGSLEGHLNDESHGLDWKTRYKIIKEACEGLKYLHEGNGLRNPVYHLDLKPDNILLDKNMTPKLADFGLSKLCGAEQTRVTQAVFGTIGYMPKEYLDDQLVSDKLDVFSMGVVITKIIAGPTGRRRSAEMSKEGFLDQVHENWRSRLEESYTSRRVIEAYCEQVIICTKIGLSSMEDDRHSRPSIVEIINKLNETETMIEKAMSGSMSVKSQREDHDMVKVEAFPRNKAIRFTETCEAFPVLVRVTAPWRHEETYRGLDVIVVSNLGMDQVHDAMMKLVDLLKPNDRLSILFCGRSGAEHVMELTYMSANGQEVAKDKINKLAQFHVKEKPNYQCPALPKAAKILGQRRMEDSASRSALIIHIWTGRMVPEIHKQDISKEFRVYTIAIGEHESNNMNRISTMTAGIYRSVQKAKDAKNELQSLFDYGWLSLDKWKSVRITLQAEEGVSISSIASSCNIAIVPDKQPDTVFLRQINGGEQKTFIVYLTVPRGKEKLVTICGKYGGKELVGMDVVMLRPRRKCLPDDDEVVIHPKVAAELLRVQLKEGIAKLNKDLNIDNLRLLLNGIKNSEDGRAAPAEILSDLEDEVAEMTHGNDGVYCDSMLLSMNSNQLLMSSCSSEGAFSILKEQRTSACKDLVKIKGFTRSKGIMYHETSHEFPVLVRVTVAPWPHGCREMPRDGVDIVAVLDISEERLELVKQAMMIVIDKLHPNDRLSILSFQSPEHRLTELTYMSDYGRDAVRFKIAHLKASIGFDTAVLEDGAQILRDRGSSARRTRLGCMMLLSDGQYTGILQLNISSEFPVHTFGLGAGHDPNAMKYVADMTYGTYSFVDQAISNIKDALAMFITGFTSIAARSMKITLKADQEIAISSIESGNYIHHVKSDKSSGTITIEDIYFGEQKDFIVNLTVGRGTKNLMTIGGRYELLDGSVIRTVDTAGKHMSVTRPRLKRHDLAINPDVAAELTRIRLQNGVLDMLETQNMTAQGLQRLWNKIKHSKEGRGAPEETLSGLSMDVAEMTRGIQEMPYTLSWLSCHQWQRATTKGTPSNSRAFRTMGQYAVEDTNLVQVRTFTRSEAIPSDYPCNKFPVLVRVLARRFENDVLRDGDDVVTVLDASAGMQGGKLKRMKELMMVIIDILRAQDRLSIVSFNTFESRLTKLTYMTDHGRNVAKSKINELVASGQGDTTAALREGAEILWWREAESDRRVGRILFLSDCNCKNNEIFGTKIRPEFPIHTFDLGTQHNPSMMKYIAGITSGTYNFVDEDIGKMKDALALCLSSVAAMSIKITLRTNQGITMWSIESGQYVNHVENNEFGTIDIDNIYPGERMDFIVYLRVAEGKKELMTIGGHYLCHDTVRHLAYTDVYVQRPHHVPNGQTIHPELATKLVTIMLEEGISAMLDKGLTIVGLQQLWEKITETDEGRRAPARTMSRLRMDIAEMKRDIENPKEYRKTGMPCTLSWLTSQNRRQAAI